MAPISESTLISAHLKAAAVQPFSHSAIQALPLPPSHSATQRSRSHPATATQPFKPPSRPATQPLNRASPPSHSTIQPLKALNPATQPFSHSSPPTQLGHGRWSAYALGHEWNYGLGRIMVWAWMLWLAYALGTCTELWFEQHGCSGQRMLLKHERNYGLVNVCSCDTNGVIVWARMLWTD